MGKTIVSGRRALLYGANRKKTVGATLPDQFDEALTDQRLGVSPIIGATFNL